MGFIYMASAYSHEDPKVRHARYLQVRNAVRVLTERRITVFSPIVHFHPLAVEAQLPTTHEFWHEHNLHMLCRADAMYVLGSPEVVNSRGVAAEFEEAQRLAIPVYLVSAPHYVPTEFLRGCAC